MGEQDQIRLDVDEERKAIVMRLLSVINDCDDHHRVVEAFGCCFAMMARLSAPDQCAECIAENVLRGFFSAIFVDPPCGWDEFLASVRDRADKMRREDTVGAVAGHC